MPQLASVVLASPPMPHAAAPVEATSRREELLGVGRDLVASLRDIGKGDTVVGDVLAGVTVAAVALPLNLALAVASGVPASAGLVAGAIGGVVAGALGGSALQVTGPAAALSVMVLALAKEFGAVGVAAATVYIGIVELLLCAALAGKLARRVPESVLAGFTSGVGLKLLDQQIPELLGFPEVVDYKLLDLAAMMHRPAWLHHVSWLAAMSGVFVAFIVTATSKVKRFPAAIVSIALITFVSTFVGWDLERVGDVPSALPPFAAPLVPDERWLDLLAAATPLALLAAAETLLSARAVDRLTGARTPHNPNLELFGQGVANVVVGFFSGMPVTGVVVRSSVNVQSGGKSKLASIVHGALLLGAVLYLSHFIATIPLAALAGLLCVIGYRLVEVSTFVHVVKQSKLEALAFLAAVAGTVSGHLMSGLVAGLAIHGLHRFLTRHEDATRREVDELRAKGVRAVVGHEHAPLPRPVGFADRPDHQTWLKHVRERPQIASTAFVHEAASVIGQVVLGDAVHVAAGSSVRADEGSPFFFGAHTNIQDGVIVHALKDRHVLVASERWAVYVGENVSIAHGAIVHGPCYIGDETFIGFKATVHDSVVGPRCYIGIGAVVVGVEIPEGRLVPHGRIVDSADEVDRLPLAGEAHHEFNADVVEVNRGLAAAYHRADGPRRGSAALAVTDDGGEASLLEREAAARPWSRMERF